MHTEEGIVEFKPSNQGLHYHDVSDENSNIEMMLVNTVRGNFEGYTHHDIKRVKEARCIQGMIANPTEKEFAGMVRKRLLTNCPVTVRNVDNANRIFGPDLANLRGKMTRTKPERVRVEYVQIPRDFVQLHKYVTLVADVMFVNGLPFLVTSLRGLSLVTIEHSSSRTAKRLAQTLERVFRIYATAGFVVQMAMMDVEFEKLRTLLPHVALNTAAAREHIGEIENQGDQGKSERDIQYPALQEATKNDGGRIATLLRDVDKFIPREIWDLRKMEPAQAGVTAQAGR